jgi:hypothetical protein
MRGAGGASNGIEYQFSFIARELDLPRDARRH